jgi:hypothetical protein
MRRKALLGLLGCGILSSLFYVGANVLGARRWGGYSLTSHTVSGRSAIGAPSRPLVIPLLTAHGALVIPFGLGVWESAGRKRALRVTEALLVGLGASDLPAPLFPMHRRQGAGAGRGNAHRHHAHHRHEREQPPDSARHSVRVYGVRRAVSPLLERDPPATRRDRRCDSHAGVPSGGQPADAVGRTDGAIRIGGYLLWQVALAIALLRTRANGWLRRRA